MQDDSLLESPGSVDGQSSIKKQQEEAAGQFSESDYEENKEGSSNKYVVICTDCREGFLPKMSTTGLKHHLSGHAGVKASASSICTHVPLYIFPFIPLNGEKLEFILHHTIIFKISMQNQTNKYCHHSFLWM